MPVAVLGAMPGAVRKNGPGLGYMTGWQHGQTTKFSHPCSSENREILLDSLGRVTRSYAWFGTFVKKCEEIRNASKG